MRKYSEDGKTAMTAIEPGSSTLRVSTYFGWKGMVDRLGAGLLLVPGLPMIAVLVALIRLTSRGPGIYSQKRVGKDGVVYTMYKLRSMRIDAEAGTGPVWCATEKDTRITPLGYWLRKLHLDELPQLINVLRGEMSLIGPRPERPEFVRVLGETIPDYLDRLLVRPGITGLAQINLPPDTDLNSVRRKLVLDREYIANASLLLDLRMFFSTFFRMVGLKGEAAMRLMCLRRDVHVTETSLQSVSAEVTPDVVAATIEAGATTTPSVGMRNRRNADPEDSGILAHGAHS
jgi:lipopolysaccharide/colanic/teichoic acid biosynthesis glycosyltransferase